MLDQDIQLRQVVVQLSKSIGVRPRAFATADEFFADYRGDDPGCILLGDQVPDANSYDVLRQLETIERRNPTVVIASPTHPADVLRAWELSAFSYIIRPFLPDEIHGKILQALAWDKRMRELWKRHEDVQVRYARLTPRESEVAELVADGETSSKIATDLDIGLRTVETHRRSVLDKLNVQTPTQLVSLLLQHRLDNCTLGTLARLENSL